MHLPFLARCQRCFRTSLPAALLVTLLQRAPVPCEELAESFAVAAPLAAIMRATLMVAGALGATHALAGASVLVSSEPSPVQGTVGTPIKPVGFTISNTGAVGSWKLTGAFPPGLSLMDPETKTSISGPGVLDAATPITSVAGSSTPSGNLHPVLLGTPTREGSYIFQLQAWQFGQLQGTATDVFEFQVDIGPLIPPSFIRQPQGAVAANGATVLLSALVPIDLTFQWQRNGAAVLDATETAYAFTMTPASPGIYSCVAANSLGAITSSPVIVGATTAQKVAGSGTVVATDVRHPNGNIFDQVLLQGQAVLCTADSGQVTRLSCIDGNDDIVQIEFSGAGTLAVFVNGLSGPAAARNYNQPGVAYVKGNVGLVIAGANETTNVSVFSVGRANAVDATLFRSDVTYDGVADIAFIAIQSANGKFGGVRAANASFSASEGWTGLFAPGVQFTGPVFLGDLAAFDRATPTLIVGAAADVRIAGGDLEQPNDRAVQVAGLTQLTMSDGSTSHGMLLPARTNRARLEQDGRDVTAQIVVNPRN